MIKMSESSGQTMKTGGHIQIKEMLNAAKAVYVWNTGLGTYVKADVPALLYSVNYLFGSTFETKDLFDDSGSHILLIRPEELQ